MHTKNIITAGQALTSVSRVLVLLHGRGGTAGDILSLSSYLDVSDFTLMAPQATNNTWYPDSFLAPPVRNEPWLSSALNLLEDLEGGLLSQGITSENIFFLGFSQGACLTLEFVTRHAKRYGGIVAFTGGLIGDRIYPQNYSGDFQNTPVFLGSGNPDPHVPVERVYATANILRDRHAQVTEKIYDHMGHTINQDEISQANRLVFGTHRQAQQ